MRGGDSVYYLHYLDEDQYGVWNSFVESSPQGTLFSTTTWLDSFDCNYRVLACYKGDEIVGGIAFAFRKVGPLKCIYIPTLTRYNGIIIRDCSKLNAVRRQSVEYGVADEIVRYLSCNYHVVNVSNSIPLKDIRPFDLNRFDITVNYTYVINLERIEETWGGFKNSLRRQIISAKDALDVTEEDNVDSLWAVYKQTFERQNIPCPMGYSEMKKLHDNLAKEDRARIFSVRDRLKNIHCSSMVVYDSKTAYYLLGGASTECRGSNAYSLMLWKVIEEMSGKVKKMDLVGANIPSISDYKKKFGGSLEHYFEAGNSRLFRMLISCKRILGRLFKG